MIQIDFVLIYTETEFLNLWDSLGTQKVGRSERIVLDFGI